MQRGYETRDFRKLQVWRKAHELVLEVYVQTNGFPRAERHGLTSQIRRAAVSIPANIAEGYGHQGDRELVRFLRIAQSSSSELGYHLLLARDLDYLDSGVYEQIAAKLEEVKSMLVGFTNKVSRTWICVGGLPFSAQRSVLSALRTLFGVESLSEALQTKERIP
jgi:four helix bundle protein